MATITATGTIVGLITARSTEVVISQTTTRTTLADLLPELIGVGSALVVGLWMLRRYDSRSDLAAERADRLIREARDEARQARDAEAQVRAELAAALARLDALDD